MAPSDMCWSTDIFGSSAACWKTLHIMFNIVTVILYSPATKYIKALYYKCTICDPYESDDKTQDEARRLTAA